MHPSRLERLVVLDARHLNVGHTAVFEFVEGVVKIPSQGLLDPVRSMEGHRALLEIIERTHVIHSRQMILVLVGVNHCIELTNALAQHLGSEIRTCVNHHPRRGRLQRHRGPKALVPWVGGRASSQSHPMMGTP